DEIDFEAQGTVYMSNYCNGGCQIYVSVPGDSSDIAENILIDDFTTKTSSVVLLECHSATSRFVFRHTRNGKHSRVFTTTKTLESLLLGECNSLVMGMVSDW
ncbi:hypothetical protein PENTCL1PPCAC_21187, partial [Pristionchus entomophagus]